MSSYADSRTSPVVSSVTLNNGASITPGAAPYGVVLNCGSAPYYYNKYIATAHEFYNQNGELSVSFFKFYGGGGGFGLYNGVVFTLNGQGQTTVGAAGAASALPAAPSKYFPISDGTTTYVVPAYLAS